MSWWSSLFGGKSGRKQDNASSPILSENDDDLYPGAVARVMESGNCSVSFVQKEFRIGFLRASKLIDAMERDNIITSLDSAGARRVLKDEERDKITRTLPANGHRPDADDPFDREFYFVPYPRITTPHSDLLLAGRKCYMSDPVFDELATRNGRWVPSNKSGQVSDFFTYTDIGQLDFAINDYWACPVTADAKKLATEPTALSLLRIRSVNGNPVLNAVDSCCRTHGCSWQLPGEPVSLWDRPRRLPLSSM